MKISDLPRELIEEILVRVPATILQRSRFTCKRWNALVNDRVFIRKNFDKAAWQSLVIVETLLGVCVMSSNTHGIHKIFVNSVKKLRLMDPLLKSKVNISQVFHCDGLLLCITSENPRLVVWNPCTGKAMWLKFINPSKDYLDIYALGNAENTSCHNYKILRRFKKGLAKRMEIYDFCSNSWRPLHVDFPPNCVRQSSGVSLKGNTYWIASSNNERVLLCFDFSKERFRTMNFPFQNGRVCLANFREEQLSVLQWNLDTKEADIWVSRRIGSTNFSFRKFLKVRLSNARYFSDGSGASLFINYDNKVVVCCQDFSRYTGNLVQLIGEEADNFREISLGRSTDFISWGDTFNYVPSLVQIQDGIVTARGKRKTR